MKGYLLDTSVALLAIHQSIRLSPAIRGAIAEGPGFLSVVAYWEVMIKAMKGTFDVGDPRQWWKETLEALVLFPLLYEPEHVAAVYDLAPIHRDPFDRALIAQATVEDLALLTTDAIMPRYASDRLRVIE